MTTKTEILKTIRGFCQECCGGVASEIPKCTVQGCHMYPFRMGKDPNPARRDAAKNLAPVRGKTNE